MISSCLGRCHSWHSYSILSLAGKGAKNNLLALSKQLPQGRSGHITGTLVLLTPVFHVVILPQSKVI